MRSPGLSAISLLISPEASRVRPSIYVAARRWYSILQSRFTERAKLLYGLRDLLLDERDKLADVLTAETGRPRAEAYGVELFYLCDAIGVWAKRSAGYLRPEKIQPHFPLMWPKKVLTTYSP